MINKDATTKAYKSHLVTFSLECTDARDKTFCEKDGITNRMEKPNTHRLEGELKFEVTITKVMCYNFVLCNFC